MKANRFQKYWRGILLIGVVSMLSMTSCKKDDPEPEKPVASFQFEVNATNPLQVVFTNFSQNATSYSWTFGDGNTSTEESPTHTFAEFGTYEVVLTAKNKEGESSTFSRTLQLDDPDVALTLLAGEVSKTWKLYRVGTSMGVGPDAAGARQYWSLTNTGLRPCVYHHEFIFHRNGTFVFDDKGSFWGEGAVFAPPLKEVCFAAIASNMVNKDGADVSAWLSGTHAFVYDAVLGKITLNGTGAWMGLPQCGTNAESIVPEPTKTFSVSITQHEGYDLMVIAYAYADLYWDFTYASYSNPALEPAVEEEEVPYGEDLPNLTPTQMFNTFASTDASDAVLLIPTTSDVTITIGVDDPANAAAAKVGKYQRGTNQYADLKFQMEYDIQFDNFTTFSIDVYVPSTNTYSEGGLTKNIQIWIADQSQTQEFWGSWVVYNVDLADVVTDAWKTYTFQLESPSEGSVGTPKTRQDLDLVGLVIGGSGHTVDGTFYVRNFKFE